MSAHQTAPSESLRSRTETRDLRQGQRTPAVRRSAEPQVMFATHGVFTGERVCRFRGLGRGHPDRDVVGVSVDLSG